MGKNGFASKKSGKRFAALILTFAMMVGSVPAAWGGTVGNNSISTPPHSDSVSAVSFDGYDVEGNGLTPRDFGEYDVYDKALRSGSHSLSPEAAAAVREYLDALDAPLGAVGFEEGFDNNPAKLVEVIVQLDTASEELLALTDATAAEAEEIVSDSQEEFLSELVSASPRARSAGSPVVIDSYTKLFNGVMLRVRADMVEKIADMGGVYAVFPNYEIHATADTPSAIGPKAPKGDYMAASLDIFNMTDIHKTYKGTGIKVGVFDTGIDYRHPDLKDVFKGGGDYIDNVRGDTYQHASLVNADGDPMETTYKEWQRSGQPEFRSYDGVPYYTEHGTHVSGIIHALAPEADIYVYRVLGPYGTGAVAGIMKAIEDHYADLDVMNFSLGSNVNLPYNPECYMMNIATLHGTVCAISAGNSGPGLQTVGTPGVSSLPITVAAGTLGGLDSYRFAAAVAHTEDPQYAGESNNSLEIRLLGWGHDQGFNDNLIITDPASPALTKNSDGSYNYVTVGLGTAGNFNDRAQLLKGAIAVVFRGGGINFTEMRDRSKNAGAGALIILNNADGFMSSVDVQGLHNDNVIPIFDIKYSDGWKLSEKGTIKLGAYSAYSPDSRLADFSSWGPVSETWAIKPDITAPGVQVMSTVPAYITNKDHNIDDAGWDTAYLPLDGTSMASPEVAGIAALMVQKFSGGNPLEIKARMMNTATPANEMDERLSVYHVGAGFINPAAALGADDYITVIDEIPWVGVGSGLDWTYDANARSLKEAELASLSFGIANVAETQTRETKKLKAKVYGGGWTFAGGDYYNSPIADIGTNAQGKVEVKATDNGDGTFDVWLQFAADAPSNMLYEGAAKFTKGGKTIRLPFAAFYCGTQPIPTPRQNIGIARPVITSVRDSSNNIVHWNGWSQYASACVGFDDPLGATLYVDFFYEQLTDADGNSLGGNGDRYYVDGIDLTANKTWFVYDALTPVVDKVTVDGGNKITSVTPDVRLGQGVYKLYVVVYDRPWLGDPEDPEDKRPGETLGIENGASILTTFDVGKFVVETVQPTLTLTGTTQGDGKTDTPYTYEIADDAITFQGNLKSFAHDMAIEHDITTILYDGRPVYDYRFAVYVLEDLRLMGNFTPEGSFKRDAIIQNMPDEGYVDFPNNYALDAYDYDMWDDTLRLIGNLYSKTIAGRVAKSENFLALKWEDDKLAVGFDKFNDSFTVDPDDDSYFFDFEYEVNGSKAKITPEYNISSKNDGDSTATFSFKDFKTGSTTNSDTLTAVDVAITAPETGVKRQTKIEDAKFTGFIEWSNPGSIFFSDTVYTATVTLWASGGKKFVNTAVDVVGAANVTVKSIRADGLQMTFEAVFDPTAEILPGNAYVVMRVPAYGEDGGGGIGVGSGGGNNVGVWGDRSDNALFFDRTGTAANALEKLFKKGTPLPDNFMSLYTIQVPDNYMGNNMRGGLVIGELGRTVPSGVYDWTWVNSYAQYFMGYGSVVLQPGHVYYFDPKWYRTDAYGIEVTDGGNADFILSVNTAYARADELSRRGGKSRAWFEGLLPEPGTTVVGVFDASGDLITAPWASGLKTSGTVNTQSAVIDFPANNTASDVVYTVKLGKSDGTWFDTAATVTVTTDAASTAALTVSDKDNSAEVYQMYVDSTATAHTKGWTYNNGNSNSIPDTLPLYDYFVPTGLTPGDYTDLIVPQRTISTFVVPARNNNVTLNLEEGTYDIYVPNMNKTGTIYSTAERQEDARTATSIYSQGQTAYKFKEVFLQAGHDYRMDIIGWNTRRFYVDDKKMPEGTLTIPMDNFTPITNGAPVNELTAYIKDNGSVQSVLQDGDYSAVVTWSGGFDGLGKFKPGTVYTAHVEITPEVGFSFASVTAFKVTGDGAVNPNTYVIKGDGISYDYTFGATDPLPEPGKAKIKLEIKAAIPANTTISGWQMAFKNGGGVLPFPAPNASNYAADYETAKTIVGQFTSVTPPNAADLVKVSYTTFVEPGTYDFALVPKKADGDWPDAAGNNFMNFWYDFLVGWEAIEFKADTEYTFTFVNLSGMTGGELVKPTLKIDGQPVPSGTLAVPLTAPVVGATPSLTVEGATYTGTVAWNGTLANGGSFDYSTVYSAHYELTPKDGGTFSGYNGFNATGAKAVTNKVFKGGVISFDATFSATEPVRELGKAKIVFKATVNNSTLTNTYRVTGFRLGLTTNTSLAYPTWANNEARYNEWLAIAEQFTNYPSSGSVSVGDSLTFYVEPGTYKASYMCLWGDVWPEFSVVYYYYDYMFRATNTNSNTVTFEANKEYVFDLSSYPVPYPNQPTGVSIDAAGSGVVSSSEPIDAWSSDAVSVYDEKADGLKVGGFVAEDVTVEAAAESVVENIEGVNIFSIREEDEAVAFDGSIPGLRFDAPPTRRNGFSAVAPTAATLNPEAYEDVTLYVTFKGKTLKTQFRVKGLGLPAESVTLDKTEAKIEVGDELTLTATIKPDDTTDGVTWSSSDETVATVVNGVVTAVGDGSAVITARADGLSADTVYAECAITVLPLVKITASAAGGTITGGKVTGGGGDYNRKANVTLTAVSDFDDQFDFLGWFEGETIVCDTEVYSFTVGSADDTPDRTLVAKFAEWRVVELGSIGYGTVSGGGQYYVGDTATVTATVPYGYTFGGWYDEDGNLVSYMAKYSFVVGDDMPLNLTAKFNVVETAYVPAKPADNTPAAATAAPAATEAPVPTAAPTAAPTAKPDDINNGDGYVYPEVGTVVDAVATTDKLMVEDKVYDNFPAVNIDDYNFIKLRDLAFILNGLSIEFSVDYDPELNAIVIWTGKPYTTADGNEMKTVFDGSKKAVVSKQRIFINGVEVRLTAFNIDGYNYFRLRDLAKLLGFKVEYEDKLVRLTYK